MRIEPVAFLIVAVAIVPAVAASEPSPPRKQLYFWLWAKNMEGHWRDFIDFTADQKMGGVVIWGLRGWRDDGKQCRELVRYAHERHVKVIHGLGLNGYEIGEHIVASHPELAAEIPPRLRDTSKGKVSLKAVFCPSKARSMELLKKYLLAAADTGVDGFNFETADVDYVTCHCADCETRFDSADETEHTNKPIEWPLAHLDFAADVLSDAYPRVWLTCEFAMQRFGKPPYTDCERILDLNRRIDRRLTVIWAEHTVPPDRISRLLRKQRDKIGFYVRSGAIRGWDARRVLDPHELRPIAQRLLALDPVCVMYRGYRPADRWAVNMGAAARILQRPTLTERDIDRAVEHFQSLAQPGARYGFEPGTATKEKKQGK